MKNWIKRSLVLSGISMMVLSAVALADDSKNKTPAPAVRQIAWDEFRERCAHPEQFDVQRAPQNIVLECSDTTSTWAAGAPGEVPLSAHRMVGSEVISDKFKVARADKEAQALSRAGSCQRFKEIQETVRVQRPLSCDEVLSLKGDLSDFCVGVVDSAKGGNPKLIETKETGKVIDTCAGITQYDNNNGKNKLE